MKTKELREKRALAIQKMQAIISKAENENRRAINADERTQFNALDNEIKELDENLVITTRADELAREAAAEARGRSLADGEGDPRQPAVTERPQLYFRTREGQEIRAYRPGENITSESRNQGSDVSFGDFIRAIGSGGRNEAERRALAEGSNSAGGYTVPTVLGERFIDLFRLQTHVITSGALTINLGSSNYTLAKMLTGATPSWRNENADVTEANPTFGPVTWLPKSLAVMVKISRELLADSVNIATALEREFARAFAVEIDRVALEGSGISPEPKGILNYDGTQKLVPNVNGFTVTNYDEIVNGVQKLYEANASAPTAIIMSPRSAANYAKLKDTTNQPLLMPGMLNNIPFKQTTAIPNNVTAGTSTGNTSDIFMGDFSQLVIGVREGMTIELARERFVDKLQVAFIVHARLDVAAVHEESFLVIRGVK